MRHWLLPLLALTLTTASARAHFIFIAPTGDSAQVVFSEGLEPDANVPIDKIHATELKARLADGKTVELAKTKGANAYTVKLPADCLAVAGACRYGVLQRGDAKPFLLVYHPKLITGKLAPASPWQLLTFEIVPLADQQFQVLFEGKPVADAEVAILTPADKTKTTTDKAGKFKLATTTPGKYALRVRNIVAKPGKLAGKAYSDERHYATLVFQVDAAKKAKAPAPDEKADPAATRLLADARAARGHWDGFPGFSANLTVNIDGKTSKGTVRVAADGKVALEGIDKEALRWTDRFLTSLVMHRRAGSERRQTPAVFADDQKDHPQGRLVRLAGDRYSSTYRIRARQIRVVNRDMGNQRFTINVMDNLTNADGKFIPTSWTVTFWDVKTGQIKQSIVNRVKWQRIGKYDLPTSASVVSVRPEDNGVGLTTSTLEFSDLELGGK